MAVRYVIPLITLAATGLLTGCATTAPVKQRTGVEEARACMRALQQNPNIIPGYTIRACTNTGVWVVDQVDPLGQSMASYDFVNGDYSGPETGYGPVPIDSLGETQIQAYQALHKSLNKDLQKAI